VSRSLTTLALACAGLLTLWDAGGVEHSGRRPVTSRSACRTSLDVARSAADLRPPARRLIRNLKGLID
jgi:hypothetical protein